MTCRPWQENARTIRWELIAVLCGWIVQLTPKDDPWAVPTLEGVKDVLLAVRRMPRG